MLLNSLTQKLHIRVETKTHDDVFIQILLAVHYCVLPGDVDGAFRMSNEARRRIATAIFDAVDARMSTTKLEDVFETKTVLTDILKADLAPMMLGFGCRIVDALVTDIRMRGWRDRWPSGAPFTVAAPPAPVGAAVISECRFELALMRANERD